MYGLVLPLNDDTLLKTTETNFATTKLQVEHLGIFVLAWEQFSPLDLFLLLLLLLGHYGTASNGAVGIWST